MKHLGTIFTATIVVFWIVMNGLFIRREVEMRRLGGYQRGVTAFLGADLAREQWLGIYHKKDGRFEKVGYSGLRIEKLHEEDGLRYSATIDTYFRGSIPGQDVFFPGLEGKSSLQIDGKLLLDDEMKPLLLRLDVAVNLLQKTAFEARQAFHARGERTGERFDVLLVHGEKELPFSLPLEALTLSDGLTPALPVAGYEVGDTYRVRVFNPLGPLGLGTDTARVRVVAQETQRFGGPLVDVYVLETEWRGKTITSRVTPDGEVIYQELGPPLNLVLQREDSRKEAKKGIDR